MVSQYYWRTQEPRPSVSKFIKSKHYKDLTKKGRNIYTIKGKIAVDKIYTFENVEDGLNHLQKKLNLPNKLDLPRTKSTSRPDQLHYRNILSNDEKKYIENFFSMEISNLGYKF